MRRAYRKVRKNLDGTLPPRARRLSYGTMPRDQSDTEVLEAPTSAPATLVDHPSPSAISASSTSSLSSIRTSKFRTLRSNFSSAVPLINND